MPTGSTGTRLRFVMEGSLCEDQRMIAHIRGPCGDQCFETGPFVCKQRANGVLVMRLVAGHRRHESIGSVLGLADAVPFLAASTSFFDQPAQRDGGPAGLPRQPFPMLWQKCDF